MGIITWGYASYSETPRPALCPAGTAPTPTLYLPGVRPTCYKIASSDGTCPAELRVAHWPLWPALKHTEHKKKWFYYISTTYVNIIFPWFSTTHEVGQRRSSLCKVPSNQPLTQFGQNSCHITRLDWKWLAGENTTTIIITQWVSHMNSAVLWILIGSSWSCKHC